MEPQSSGSSQLRRKSAGPTAYGLQSTACFFWYRREEGIAASVLLLPLSLLSLLFWALAALDRRIFASRRRARARVVSVGNLTVGGAGKTPVAIHLARLLKARGEQVAVLSRGFGRRGGGAALVVSDPDGVRATVERSGDEPWLIARACPGVAVLVGKDRAQLADEAVASFGASALILDDGLQHHRLARDLDVVVLDASNPFGNGHLIPRGPLRERKSALARAGLVWLAKVDQASPGEVEALAAEVSALTAAPQVRSVYRVADVLDGAGSSRGPDWLAGRRVMLVAGLARPQSFRRTLAAAGAQVVAEALFADHHWFTEVELCTAARQAREAGAQALALTEKDAVRLPRGAWGAPLAVVRIELEVRAGSEAVDRALEAVWAR